MGRQLFTNPNEKLPLIVQINTMSLFVLWIGIVCVLSILTLVCAFHQKPKKPKESQNSSTNSELISERKILRKLNSKAHSMAKMISWRKNLQEGELDFDGETEEDAVWRKTILMGEKCRPLDFSGKIEYDSNGNIVVDSHPTDYAGR